MKRLYPLLGSTTQALSQSLMVLTRVDCWSSSFVRQSTETPVLPRSATCQGVREIVYTSNRASGSQKMARRCSRSGDLGKLQALLRSYRRFHLKQSCAEGLCNASMKSTPGANSKRFHSH
jgi:hypothetical protein